MLVSVKYALDAQNNVGIFTADLKLGDSAVVFREERDQQLYEVSFVNEGGVLFVRVVDPSRAARGEPTKVRKRAQTNEVFSVGSCTVMIMALHGQTAERAEPEATPAPAIPVHVVQIGPEDSQVSSLLAPPANTQNVANLATSPPAPSPVPTAAVPTAIPVSVPPPAPTAPVAPAVAQETNKASSIYPTDIQENTFVRNMTRGMKSDPTALPPVVDIGLNYDYQAQEQDAEKASNESEPAPLGQPVIPRRETKTENLRGRNLKINPKSREQLLTEDVRDRRFFLKGKKYSIRNKVSALVLSLGVFGIGVYSVGVSQIAGNAQKAIFTASVQSQIEARGAELTSRLKNYNHVINALIHALSQEKVDPQVLSKGFVHFDFMVGVGVFKYLSNSEVETPPAPLKLPTVLPKRKQLKIGIPIVVELPKPKYDLSKLKKLDDGNYLEPQIQWIHEAHARALNLEFGALSNDQMSKVIEMLGKSGNGPAGFDFKNLVLPGGEKGYFTYVVRSQPVSPIFIVIQTTPKFIADLFVPSNDINYYLVSKKQEILFPEVARGDQELLASLRQLLESNRSPASENHFTGSVSVTPDWDLIGRPTVEKTASSMSNSSSYYVYGFAVLLLFFGVGLWFARNITYPLLSMVNHIESLVAGDYHKPLVVESNDEIGQVADYFEHLTSQLRAKEQELARVTDLASKDSLTGLFNHRYFRANLESRWREIESGRGGALILIDVDNFRMFNMAHGHIQGDLILKDLAQAVVEAVGKAGLVSRYGSEELIVWAPSFDQRGAFDLAEKILQKIRSTRTVNLTGGNPFAVNCSLGVTIFNKSRHMDVDHFLKDADSNLSMAKKAGKNRVWAGAV